MLDDVKRTERGAVSENAKRGRSGRVLLMVWLVLLTQRVVAAGATELASALFAEGQWAAAGLESRRVLATELTPDQADCARLLSALSALRLRSAERQAALQTLEALWKSESSEVNLRCRAAYERALVCTAPDEQLAGEALIFAYSRAEDVKLFWQAGCALYFHFQEYRAWRLEYPGLWQTLQTTSSTWPAEVVQDYRKRTSVQRTSWSRLPARWLVRFYRAQISPAIGSRCELKPSCSAYLLEACQAHGLLGFTLMADRFIREPSVYDAKEKPVVMPDGRIRYADPLADHDFWIKEKQ